MKSKGFIYCLILLSTLINCSENRDDIPTLIVGNDFINSSTRVIEIDTFKIELSTIKFDSIVTTASNRLLVGQFFDTNFGQTNSAAYFELASQEFFINLDNNAELDSIGLILGYDNYYYNDTTLTTTMSIHRLNERIRPDDISLFNTTITNFEEDPITSFSYSPEPSQDSIYINLPDSFSLEFFDQIMDGEIDDNPSLVQILPGFTLQPDGGPDSPVIGFSTSSDRTYLRIFYKVPDELGEDQFFFDLQIDPTSSDNYYNKITSNVSSLPVSSLLDQEEQLSSIDNNYNSLIQSGVGFATKVEFPTIRTISEINGDGAVMNATLELIPNLDSFNENQKVMDSLVVNILDQNHFVTEQLNGRLGDVFAFYLTENEEFNNYYYSADVTNFIVDKVNEAPITENSLVLFPPDFNSSINKILLHDQNGNENEARLIITYAIYDED
ncbi:MAG: DUF4270 family protein [bacterium]